MTYVNRLNDAKRLYASGNRTHPYVIEFLSELQPQTEEPAPQKRAKRKVKKRGRK